MSQQFRSAREIAMSEAVEFAESNIPDCLFTASEIGDVIRNAFLALNLSEEERRIVSEHTNSIIENAASRHKSDSSPSVEAN